MDPEVTGVLPIAVGKATRLLEYMEAAGKVYEGEVTLGFSTDTEDAQGKIISKSPLENEIPASEIDTAMEKFVGLIQQTPPMYSAVKINGKKLYEYARQGVTIDRPKRTINIHEFVRTSPVVYDSVNKTESFTFRVSCSKGTYVRTLSVDLAKALGLEGHMSKLQRTAANGLKIEEAVTLEQIESYRDTGKLSELIYPIGYAVSDLPQIDLSLDQMEAARVGKKFSEAEFTKLSALKAERFAALYDGKLVAVYMRHPEKEGIWKPNKVFG